MNTIHFYNNTKLDTAFNSIKDTYDINTLRDISIHGCASGCASHHIYTTDCVDFYNNHQDEIDDYICNTLDVNSVMELTTDCGSIQDAICHLCWIFIELVAAEYAGNTEEYDQEMSMTLIS